MSNLNNKTVLNNAGACFPGRPNFRNDHHFKRHFMTNSSNNLFSSLDDTLLPRQTDSLGKHLSTSGHPPVHLKHEMLYPSMNAAHPSHMESMDLMEPLCSPSLPHQDSTVTRGNFYNTAMNPPPSMNPQIFHNHHQHHLYRSGGLSSFERCHQDEQQQNPRDLEAFAERFKQRRIKLGVTQADVGRALVHLKLPGVGTLSQSTICRFESLTLSRNNMLALRPVLQSWLEAAELQARGRKRDSGSPFVLPVGDKKRKRTSIAALEKRSLEAYFAVQQRPSGDKIASIAEKLDLKKSVVRVWFCNQRQKQKRMKYSASINTS
ncbi:hypothetical protein JTE90_019328 [Oedothorax gibbosus]|uniref:POU domain protein n=1 Tax=Oedothorax gibbosus TaxID=931172 RepID=A0AAV6UJW4_9ARAC|nr:hypothetical protein JTE90_019328 [Oedothorax gibbosus]